LRSLGLLSCSQSKLGSSDDYSGEIMKIHYYRDKNRTVGWMILLLLSSLGGLSWWTWGIWTNTSRNPWPISANVEQSTTPKSLAPSLGARPQIYLLQVANEQIHLIPTPVAVHTTATEPALKEAFHTLFTQIQRNSQSTVIPSGTHLNSLHVAKDKIYVDLSREFEQGGGSTSMIYRVAQILYTATSLDSKAKVFLSVEGHPLDERHPLGGEGLILRQPITRQEFTKEFSLS
jgi:spore germination protein GerM